MSLTSFFAFRDRATSKDDLVSGLALAESLDRLQTQSRIAYTNGQSTLSQKRDWVSA
jgi:hypothetical protein